MHIKHFNIDLNWKRIHGFITEYENPTNGKPIWEERTWPPYSKKKLTIAEKKLPGNSKTFKAVKVPWEKLHW
jgi:hypothetical protein